ncbi:Phosphotriesterase-related protein [Eumeta japonica]|uniref:Phosphotriesterase-related protein n=1 Tax=Eumeta variegata TaxID=151549 RepID=A0A4C1T2M5_EUMVA|nr:Phosphotriesterase-related protein [Eumeta japonica]
MSFVRAQLTNSLSSKRTKRSTIVENTTNGLNRNLALMKSVSEKSGVHIIAGTGFYIEDLQADNVRHFAQEEIYNHMVKELTVGCDGDHSVKAGFMGEIASVWPLRGTLLEDEQLLEFAKLGAYCQLDLFGVEVSYYQLNIDTDMPSDAQRLQKVKLLIDEGHENRVLMSHDIHTKHRLTTYGGHGYAHILNNILPRMKSKGISNEKIDLITIENPADWLIGSTSP